MVSLLPMMMLFLTGLVVISNANSDYLPHRALEDIPAEIGSDAELRCSKIVEKMSSDYIESAYNCSYSYENNGEKYDCKHKWYKDGIEITDFEIGKYKFSSSLAYDYCENFEQTTRLVKDFGFIQYEGSDKYRYKEMQCYSSSLTISNIQQSDFGSYSCNFSNHNQEKLGINDMYHEEYSDILNMTLYNVKDTSHVQSVGVQYFESFYVQNIRDQLLLQCVVSGASLNWYIFYETEQCKSYYWKDIPPCVEHSLIKVTKEFDIDRYHCFDWDIREHSPVSGVTESFIFLSNICSADTARLFCAADNSPREEHARDIGVKNEDWDYFGRGIAIGVGSGIIVPLFILLLFVTTILTCVRGNICTCACCKRKGGRPHVLVEQQPGAEQLQMQLNPTQVQPNQVFGHPQLQPTLVQPNQDPQIQQGQGQPPRLQHPEVQPTQGQPPQLQYPEVQPFQVQYPSSQPPSYQP